MQTGIFLTTKELDDMMRRVAECTAESVMKRVRINPTPIHYSMKQAAQILNISETTLRERINAGKVRLNDLGKVPSEEIDRLRKPAGL